MVLSNKISDVNIERTYILPACPVLSGVENTASTWPLVLHRIEGTSNCCQLCPLCAALAWPRSSLLPFILPFPRKIHMQYH